MELNDKKYRQVTNSIGIALIVLVVMTQVGLLTVPALVQEILLPLGEDVAYITAMMFNIVLYLASFMVPAFILRGILKKKGLLRPMLLDFHMPVRSVWLIPVGIAVCFAASMINSFIINIFVPTEILNSAVETMPYEPYQIVFEFISIALVPAVCEEFLFSGTVAANLMPFGNGVAVIGSAVLFAMMHQNPYQIFYTMLAGIVMGYVYVKTKSILCSTILHFVNNGISVFQSVCLANLDEERGMVLYYIVTVIVFVLGAFGAAIYFAIEKGRKRKRFELGSFGKIIEAEDDYAQIPVSKGSKLKGFLSPAMIVYCALVISNIGSTLLVLLMISVIGI